MSSTIMTLLAAFLILMGALSGDVGAQSAGLPVKALYGFSPKEPAFPAVV
jgi:hypothetical protein